MNPIYHARSSAHRHGGHWRDYVAVHSFFDQSKAAFPSVQHRVFLHTTDFGRAAAVATFGNTLQLTGGGSASVEELVDQHLREDLGFRVTMDDWLNKLDPPEWAVRSRRRRMHPKIARFVDNPTEAAAATWGGAAADYAPVLAVLKLPTTLSPHPLARLVTMNSLGIFVAERIVGEAIETADGHIVPTRLVAERMVQAEMGLIPHAAGIAGRIGLDPWMHGALVREADRLWPEDHDDEEGRHDE
jgi:hypothetical protein